jgi:hypothetical protein
MTQAGKLQTSHTCVNHSHTWAHQLHKLTHIASTKNAHRIIFFYGQGNTSITILLNTSITILLYSLSYYTCNYNLSYYTCIFWIEIYANGDLEPLYAAFEH